MLRDFARREFLGAAGAAALLAGCKVQNKSSGSAAGGDLDKTLQGMAEQILAGQVKDGDRVVISAGKQGLTFNGKLAVAA